MRCLARTVHGDHGHHCDIEPSPHPVTVKHKAPCGTALWRWKDNPVTEPDPPAEPDPALIAQVAAAAVVPPQLETVVCSDAPTDIPAAIRAINAAHDSGWTTQLDGDSTKVTLKLERNGELGHVIWTLNPEGLWRFTSCAIAGQKFGARAIAARLAVAVPRADPLATVPPPVTAFAATPGAPSAAAVLAPAPPTAPAPAGGVMPVGTLASFMLATPGKAAPVNGNTEWATAYAGELRSIIEHAGRTSDRNLQVHLGPSELGVDCDRQVAGKFAGVPEMNFVASPWPSILGTAGHAWLADVFKRANNGAAPRWVPEHRVIPHPDHSGTADLYDAAWRAVVDWKILSADKIDQLAAKGPSTQYRRQLLLYGLGYQNLGAPVDRVVLAALPRTKATLDNMYVWDHPLTDDDQREIEEVWRLTGIRRSYAEGITSGQITLMDVPSTPDADTCYFCPFYRPGATEDGGIGCPGTKQH